MHSVNVNFSRTSSRSLNQYAVRRRRRRGRRHHRRLDRSVRLGRAAALVLEPLEPARRDAVAAHRQAALAGVRLDAARSTRHTLRFGGDFRLDDSDNQTDANARGAFVFTGLYAAGGSAIVRARRRARLRRLPARPAAAGDGAVRTRQRARCRARSMSAFLQDDWRKSATLTFNLGVRYELIWPFFEDGGRW